MKNLRLSWLILCGMSISGCATSLLPHQKASLEKLNQAIDVYAADYEKIRPACEDFGLKVSALIHADQFPKTAGLESKKAALELAEVLKNYPVQPASWAQVNEALESSFPHIPRETIRKFLMIRSCAWLDRFQGYRSYLESFAFFQFTAQEKKAAEDLIVRRVIGDWNSGPSLMGVVIEQNIIGLWIKSGLVPLAPAIELAFGNLMVDTGELRRQLAYRTRHSSVERIFLEDSRTADYLRKKLELIIRVAGWAKK